MTDLRNSYDAWNLNIRDLSPVRNLELRLYEYFGGILIAHGLGTAALTVALLQLLR